MLSIPSYVKFYSGGFVKKKNLFRWIYGLLIIWYDDFDYNVIIFFFGGSGATNPEYVVTADDVDKYIAVECIPMDENGRQVL